MFKLWCVDRCADTYDWQVPRIPHGVIVQVLGHSERARQMKTKQHSLETPTFRLRHPPGLSYKKCHAQRITKKNQGFELGRDGFTIFHTSTPIFQRPRTNPRPQITPLAQTQPHMPRSPMTPLSLRDSGLVLPKFPCITSDTLFLATKRT